MEQRHSLMLEVKVVEKLKTFLTKTTSNQTLYSTRSFLHSIYTFMALSSDRLFHLHRRTISSALLFPAHLQSPVLSYMNLLTPSGSYPHLDQFIHTISQIILLTPSGTYPQLDFPFITSEPHLQLDHFHLLKPHLDYSHLLHPILSWINPFTIS